MIIILITILIALVIAGITIKKNWKTHTHDYDSVTHETTLSNKITMCIFRPIIAILLGCMLGVMLAVFIGLFLPKKPVLNRAVPIYSIEDTFGADGTFYLGFGNVKNTSYYYYYRQNGEGVSMDKIEAADDVIIIEQDSVQQPRIEFFENDFVNKKCLLWGIPSGHPGTKIIVPKNSVKTNFNFDLK